MIFLFIALLCGVQGTDHAAIGHMDYPDIPITVLNTWTVPYASDIQGICFAGPYLVIRSSSDGKLYLADPVDCSYQDEILMPPGENGFGVAFTSEYSGRYYINSTSTASIFYSDGSDSWSSFPNPADVSGAGMNFDLTGGSELFEASAISPYQFHGIEPDGSSYDTYSLPGVTDDISGFTPHEMMTLGEYPPIAIILTTRQGHEFLFYWGYTGSIIQYGQEPCPIPVSESLGLAWSPNDLSVYWSYKGLDDLYYISKLEIPVFGGIEDDLADLNVETLWLSIDRNPASGSANLSVSIAEPEHFTLEVFDVTGRVTDTFSSGILNPGEQNFCFEGSPGLYIAVLKREGSVEQLKFVLYE